MNPTAPFTAESQPSTERVAARKPRAEGKRHHPFTASLCYFLIAILVLTAGSQLAKGYQSPVGPNGLHITNFDANPQTGGVVLPGQVVHFYGNITENPGHVCFTNGGPTCLSPITANGLTNPGYHLYWFFGKTNTTGNVTNDTAFQMTLPAGVPPGYSSCSQGTTNTSCVPVVPSGCSQDCFEADTTYSHAGTYVVSLTAYDANFNFVIAQTEVTVVAPHFGVKINSITSSATPNGVAGLLEGVPAMFSGQCLGSTQSCANVLLKWNFGDGSVGYGTSAAHTYLERAQYAVTLTGIDSTTNAMNRTFALTNVTNLPPFGGVSSRPGSLVGPNPIAYYPKVTSNPYTVVVGTPVELCAIGYDYEPIDEPNLTFQWRFLGANDWGYSYSYPDPGNIVPPAALGQDLCIPGPPLPGVSGLSAAPVLTVTSHTFACPGWYNITTTVIDEERANSTSYRPLEVHVVNLAAPPVGEIANYTTPVGTTAFLNATNTLSQSAGPGRPAITFPNDAAFYNMTWAAGTLGPTYGDIGRITAFRPVNQTVTLTATANTTALPCCSSTPVNVNTWAKFYDVAPTVGIDSVYTQASITLKVESPYYYSYLNFTLLENGVTQGWYNMSYFKDYNTVTFAPIDFQMSDNWKVQLKYTPYGDSGGTYVDVVYNWLDDNTITDNYDATETDASSDTTHIWFSNSNTTAQNTVYDSVNYEALGEPIFGSVVFFSPAQTHLTETWAWGDGSPWFHGNTSRPATPEPTMDTWTFEAAYNVGANYVFNITACDEWELCGYDQITIDSTLNLTVSDTAPFVQLAATNKATVEDGTTTVPLYVTNQDNLTGPAKIKWQWGDSGTSTNTSMGGTVYGTHIYNYGGRYALVVYASSGPGHLGIRCPPSCGGSTSVNWTWVNVANPSPVALYNITPVAPYASEPVKFLGANSSDDMFGNLGLSFGWMFGDAAHHVSGGQDLAGFLSNFVYTSVGTYTTQLTVQDPEGRYGYLSQSVTVSPTPIQSPFPAVASGSTTADIASWYHVTVPAGSSFAKVPLVNATWNWGDGSLPSWGLNTEHTYLYPGTWELSVVLTGPNMGTHTCFANTTVLDGTPVISLPFGAAEIYGELHSMIFNASVLGDYADQGKSWNFTWNWGDGTSWNNATNTGNRSVQVHTYNYSGPVQLSVNASGPYRTLGAPSALVSDSMISAIDSDGDGLPDSYEIAVTQTNPYLAATTTYTPPPGPPPFARQAGTGCTDYVGANCNTIPGVGAFNADADGDGLTNIQEMLGLVTGFYSDPLQANTAGDGIPDGQHFFTDAFSANESTFFNGTPASDAIPGVSYFGPAIALNQTRLMVQLTTTGVPLYLQTPSGKNISLGTQNVAAETYYLLNNSPMSGASSRFGLSPSDLFVSGTWTIWANPAMGTSGLVSTATLSTSYFGDPGHADPLHQGMLQGHGLTTPIFNCSANVTENFSAFDPATFSVKVYTYWPYTLTYFKLSVQQGVPYVTSENASLLGRTNSGTACAKSGGPYAGPTTTAMFEATATYLGDADFGISAWNAHAAGDPVLTNGMKALGSATYNWTRGQYLLTGASGPLATSAMQSIDSAFAGYPADPMGRYFGPLNPTALSTSGSGAPDSEAPDPIHALGLRVTIHSATDNYCYLAAQLFGPPQDIVSVGMGAQSALLGTLLSQGRTIYTPAGFGGGGSGCAPVPGSCSISCVYTGQSGYGFSWGSVAGLSYFFPLQAGQTSFPLTFNLWQNQSLTQQPPRATVTVTGSVYDRYPQYTPNGAPINASFQIVPLSRAPVLLVNKSADLQNVSGYGLRWIGEQQMFSFDFQMGAGLGPYFKPGLNVILESRAAYLQSAASVSNLTALSCLSSAQVEARPNNQSGEWGAAESWQANLSTNPSCGTSLLQELLPLNNTGSQLPLSTSQAWQQLNTTQLELLGLNPQTLFLVPYLVPSGYSTASGTPPTNLLSDLGQAALNGFNALAGGLLALATFLAIGLLLGPLGLLLCGQFGSCGSLLGNALSFWVGVFRTLATLTLQWALATLEAAVQAIVNLAHGYEKALNAAANGYIGSFETDFGTSPELGNGWNSTTNLFLSFLGGGGISSIFSMAAAVQDPYSTVLQLLLPYLPPSSQQLLNTLFQAFGGIAMGGGLIGDGLGVANGMIGAAGLTGAFYGLSTELFLTGMTNKVISHPSTTPMPYNDNRTHFVDSTNRVSFTNISILYAGVDTTGRSNASTAVEWTRFAIGAAITLDALFSFLGAFSAWRVFAKAYTNLDNIIGPAKISYQDAMKTEGDALSLDVAVAGIGLALAITGLVIGAIVLAFQANEKVHAADEILLTITCVLDFVGALMALIATKNPYVAIASGVALDLGIFQFWLVNYHA